MLNLYTINTKSILPPGPLAEGEAASVVYHDLFDYPLNFADIIKWRVGKGVAGAVSTKSIKSKNGYFFLEEREGLIYKRILRKRTSERKVQIARKASEVLRLIPTVKMVALTGSLAMNNSTEDGDIDLLIATRRGTL